MSDLLKRQIDTALAETEERRRRVQMMAKGGTDKEEVEEYERETQQMRWDCLRGMQWLENCRR